ncbi:MAG: DNA polymerase I [Treponematales bacterium]
MSEPGAGGKAALFLIDAYGLIYRSYFAFLSRPLRSRAGKNVSALFGFARTLVSLLDDGVRTLSGAEAPGLRGKPRLLAAAFDPKEPTFRHKLFAGYKATRQKAPEDLHAQTPLVEEFLSALGVRSLCVPGFEADDIIATLAGMCRAEGRECFILSSDKDLLQLVGGGTAALRPSKTAREDSSRGGLPCDLVGPAEVKAEWGVGPEKMLDLLSLTGDSSDNVPGVKGVGDKTAVSLMTRYGSLEAVYENLAGIEGAVGRRLAEGRESAFFSRGLIKLNAEVPLGIASVEELSVENLDRRAGAAVLLREDIRQIARKLDGDAGGAAGGGAAREEDAERGAAEGTDADAGDAAAPFNPCAGVKGGSALRGAGAYRVIGSVGELEALLEGARKQKLLALDFETDSLDAWNAKPIGVSLALKPKEAFYAPVAAHEGTAPFLDPGAVRALLAPLFADPGMVIAAHNAKYDYKVSRGWGVPRWSCQIWDTMVAAWLCDPERNNYSLDSLAAFFFDVTPVAYFDIVPKGGTFDAVPLETACRYSAEDADLCLRLKALLEERLEASSSLGLFKELEMPLLPVLAEMEGSGIMIEPRVLKEYGEEMGKELARIQADTFKAVGHEFNLSSTKQLQEVLFVERGLKPGKKTKTGYSTDVAVLEELAREDEVPARILRFRTLSKLKSTYVDALADLADREGRLHTNFVQTGTATGRLSSREPNLQNIPIRDEEGRRIREAFVAKPGCLLISADYSQIELVILAHLSGDENLVSAFRDGKDVHARTAALIFGVDEAAVKSEQRRIAKTINFGVMYGMSAFRLAGELGISRTEAAAFIEAYFKTYSGVRAFITGLIKKTEETSYASTLRGRRRYIQAINSRNKTEKAAAERVAVNTPIQGSAADIVKTAMLRVDKALAAAGSRTRMLLQVHDELILESPRAEADAAAALVRREMEAAEALKVPLRVSVETGKRWGDFH